MSDKKLINKNEKIFPIAKYDYSSFNESNGVSFTGSAIIHPYNDNKFMLICDPMSDHTQFYEFNKKDVLYVKDLSSMSSADGENIQISKIWIKDGVVALRYEPFIVGKTNSMINKIKKGK